MEAHKIFQRLNWGGGEVVRLVSHCLERLEPNGDILVRGSGFMFVLASLGIRIRQGYIRSRADLVRSTARSRRPAAWWSTARPSVKRQISRKTGLLWGQSQVRRVL